VSLARNAFHDGIRALLPSLVGLLPFGLITGVAGMGIGLGPWETLGLSMIAFSGVVQLAVYQLMATSAPVPVILLAATVISLRLLMYSAALAPHLGHLPLRWKALLAYFSTDQGFAAGIAYFNRHEQDPDSASRNAWFCLGGGLVQWLPWQIAVAVGALLGAQVPASWSLDFAVPLTFLAMLVPIIKDRGTAAAGGVAGIVTLLAAAWPFRLGLVAASVAGIVAGLLSDRKRR
jgi:predicted branched-subunit amino acid permease